MLMVSYGGGTNSTAMLCGMVSRKCSIPDVILFADTGGERPSTYDYIVMFSAWLQDHGFPAITTVRNQGSRNETLEQMCLRLGVLPSVAYGWKTCSHRFKIEPQERWMNNNREVRQVWSAGGTVERAIGFCTDEENRAKPSPDKKYTNIFPLLDWGWDRDDCVRAITDSGLPLPGKSACFFCPNASKQEVLALAPDLADRAIAMERRAAESGKSRVAGLGRRWSWEALRNSVCSLPVLDNSSEDMPCGCYDG